MKLHSHNLIIIALLLLMFPGCSSNSGSPVTPGENESVTSIPMADPDQVPTNSEPWGIWNIEFNLETQKVEISADRDAAAHFNVTTVLPAPIITINSFDPVEQTVDVDVEINNDSQFLGYDLRLIIYTDSYGHKLLNADDWTSLHDLPGGLPINPFKAYAKGNPDRGFPGKTSLTENLIIALPGLNPNVTIAIDVSYPGNCDEPYEISGFSHDTLTDRIGSSAQFEATILDWQDDVSTVNLFAPSIFGSQLVHLNPSGSDLWRGVIVNYIGASPGDYTAYLIARSSNSGSLALFDEVSIHISPVGGIHPVGNLVINVNRKPDDTEPWNLRNGIIPETPWTLSWESAQGAVEYAVYYDNDPSDGLYNNYLFVDSVDGGTTSFDVPVSHWPDNHWVPGLTYIVRSRAVVGDPSSETVDSESAFIMVSAFDTMDHNEPFGAPGHYSEGWITAVERYPYSTIQSWMYWPHAHGQADYWTSPPNRLSTLNGYWGADWTVGTGNQSDYYPGHLIAETIETPFVDDSALRELEFVGFCSNLFLPEMEGGIVIGSVDSLDSPMDGWDGTDFKWARAYEDGPGVQPYMHDHSESSAYPFPFDMSEYEAGENNCWRWEG